MRDTLLNDLINTLERHGCEIKVSIPTTRGRAERSSTDSDLGRRINTLRDQYGMTLAKIAGAADLEAQQQGFRGIRQCLDWWSNPQESLL